jgi:hypothetical protein
MHKRAMNELNHVGKGKAKKIIGNKALRLGLNRN